MRSLPHQKLPVYFRVDDQIEYVTDNERDAEALGCSTGRRVVVESRVRAELPSNVSNVQPLQTSERPDVSDVQTSHTPQRSDVPSIQTSETFQNFIDKTEARESADISSLPL